MFKIRNNKNHVLNLGTKQGRMLMFNANEEKEVSKEIVELFEHEIAYYDQTNLISIVSKVNTEKKKEVVSEQTKNVIKEDFNESKSKKRKKSKK